jgi:hypothetical protein
MPLARMVSFGRSILNTGELGNNQNVPPASVGICHFPALLPPPPQPILVLTLAGPARARGARAKNVGRARRARKSGKFNRLLTNPNACFVYRNSLIPRARAT